MSGIGGIEGGQIREVKQLSSFYFIFGVLFLRLTILEV